MVTVTEAPRPHVVSALVRLDGESLLVDVGPTTRSNLAARPGCALVWDPASGGEYQLILDGSAEDVGTPGDDGVSTVRLRVVGGILHRLAGLPDGVPTCKSLADAASE